MKRWHWNYLIDALLFLSMMSIAGIGLLMKYILLPGRDVHLLYGRQGELFFLGLDRHQWGTIHFIISLVLLGLLLLHIILHWSMIITFFKKFVPRKNIRYVLGYAFVIMSIVFLGFPIFARPEFEEQEPLRLSLIDGSRGSEERTPRRTARDSSLPTAPAPGDTIHESRMARVVHDTLIIEGEEHTLDIRGFMSIREVAQKYSVPESHILERLGISDPGAARERLGRLRESYQFTMSDIEEIIKTYQREHIPPE